MSIEVATEQESAEARNSRGWRDHFWSYPSRQTAIPWDQAVPLTAEARRVLLPSLQDFQLGESSEGRHGQARAAAYAARIADPFYAEAVRLFFAEENRHAAYLAHYLRLSGVEPIGRSWTDFIFRRARRLLGLETLLTVLLSAELIGQLYYRAVLAATGCPALRAVCAQLLRDERMHVRFHVERFRFLWAGRSRGRRALQRLVWARFFGATCLAVWAKHRRAFWLGGVDFRRFRTEARHGLRRTLAKIDPGPPAGRLV